MGEKPIFGASRIADYLEVSERTVRRMARDPLNDFMFVSSMSNDGGGLGRALSACPSSLDNFVSLLTAHTRDQRRKAADARWDPSSGSSL